MPVRVVPRADRERTLLEAGVPAAFLRVVAGLSQRSDGLEWCFRDESVAYSYLSALEGESLQGAPEEVRVLHDREITPLTTDMNGDTFLPLCRGGGQPTSFVDYGLEEGLCEDYGSNFQLCLANLLIFVYECCSEWSADQFVSVAEELGFARPRRLVEELMSSRRGTSEEDRAWRSRVLTGLVA